MTPADKATLRALAEKATPGPWEVERDYTVSPDIMAGGLVLAVTVASEMSRQMDAHNAAYIAAANPAAVLALLDENARMREALTFYGGHDPDNSDHGEWLESMNEDGGDVARAALEPHGHPSGILLPNRTNPITNIGA